MVNEHCKHLWNRAGFGMPLSRQENWRVKELSSYFFSDSLSYQPLSTRYDEVLNLKDSGQMSTMDKTELQKIRTDYVRSLNFSWYMRMASGKGVLREKMTLFWTNHFSCRSNNPLFVHQLHETIRKHALGSFRELMLGVSRSPAMLQFLNNQQNRKTKPNENFAREVMELFTLGRGHYSEQDVREAARAFTGWSFNQSGEFEFRERVHDAGVKTVLGRTGHFKGEDVLRILLEQKQTARWLVSKFWKNFVSTEPDAQKVNELADIFYDSDYSIQHLVSAVFESEWFYDKKYRGQLIKSPVELLVPLIRDFNIRFENHNVLLGFQKLLGQVLFSPPNVAGWPGGRNWIDSSSLAIRLRLPQIMLKNEVPDFETKPDADANNPFREGNSFGNFKTIAEWSDCLRLFETEDDRQLIIEVSDRLLPVRIRETIIQLGIKNIKGHTKDEKIRSVVLFLTNLPEYQMC